MGSSLAQVAPSTQPQGQPVGKGFASPSQTSSQIVQQPTPTDSSAVQPQGKGGNITFPGQGGQPKMGQPNMYPNTIGQWDNASIQPQQPFNRGGKGKG
jgi:hypothetical protein